MCNSTQYQSTLTTCGSCNPTCATCSGAGPTSCSTCSVANGTPYFSSSNPATCVASCQAGFYVHNGVCTQCDPSCTTCNGAGSSACASCSGSLALSGSQCVSQCPAGTYFNTTTNVCTTCNGNCATCTGGGSNQCSSCTAPLHLQGTSCVSTCNSNQFVNGNNACQSKIPRVKSSVVDVLMESCT